MKTAGTSYRVFLWSQSLHIWQMHWVFCLIFAGIEIKTSQNSLYSLVFFKILKEPALFSTETNNTSYESPDTQLFGAGRMRAWHYHGGATPTSCKTVCYFSFWGRGGQEGWKKLNNFWLGQNSASHECTDTTFMT